jgi:hypothetical protein
MLQQLCSVISKKWFFGLITAKQAESVIAYASPGLFKIKKEKKRKKRKKKKKEKK